MKRSLHTEAMCWLRFGKRLPIVCTEAGPWYADVLGLSDKMSVEVEVKKSRSDLLAEFRNKAAKHYAYANAETGPASFVPNYFYFYVPPALGESTVELIEERFPKAGVAVQVDSWHLDGKNTKVLRKATRLREAPPRPGFVKTAIQRMSSELCGRYVAMDLYYEAVRETMVAAEKSAVDAAFRASGALDCEDLEGDMRARAAELAFAVEQVQNFGALSEVEQQKWLAAASRWLEAQYITSEEWRNASFKF